MHHLKSSAIARRFKTVAFLFCLVILLLHAAIAFLLPAMLLFDRRLVVIGVTLAGLAVVAGGLNWMLAIGTKCPLCLTPVLAARACSKHRHARTLLGSYRLRVALAILFLGSFRCPYCNEPTAIMVRERNGGTYPRRSRRAR